MVDVRNLVRLCSGRILIYTNVAVQFRISNTFRAYKPQELQDPMVAFAIFSSVTLTNAGQVPTMANGLAFIKQLFLTFMLGFAIATGVSLLVLPITNRHNFFIRTRKYATTIHAILEAQRAYLRDRHDGFSTGITQSQNRDYNVR